MLDAPTGPLAEGVKSPVPAEFVEKEDAVRDITVGAGRPIDRGEFADVDAAPVCLLEFSDGLEGTAKEAAIPATFRVRIGDSLRTAAVGGANSLMGELAGLVHVDLIDDVGHREGREVTEGG